MSKKLSSDQDLHGMFQGHSKNLKTRSIYQILSIVIVLFFLVSLALTGSLSSLYSNENTFITIDGKEVIKSDDIGGIEQLLSQLPSESIETKRNYVNMWIQDIVKKRTTPLVAKKLGLIMPDENIAKIYREDILEYKEMLEAQDISLSLNLPKLMNSFVEDFYQKILFENSADAYVDELSIKKEFFASKYKTTLAYTSFTLNDYLEGGNFSAPLMAEAYQSKKNDFATSFEALVLSFPSSEEAMKQKELLDSKDPKTRLSFFSKASKKTISLTKNQTSQPDINALFTIRSLRQGEISSPIAFQDKFLLFYLVNFQAPSMSALSPKDKEALVEYIRYSLKDKVKQEFQIQAKRYFNFIKKNQLNRLKEMPYLNVKRGITAPIAINHLIPLNAQTQAPLDIFQQFHNWEAYAFNQKKEWSPILETEESFLIFKPLVIEQKESKSLIPLKERETIDKTLKEREEQLLQSEMTQFLSSLVLVDVNFKNIYRAVGVS